MADDLTPEPPRDCQICERLVAYRQDNRAEHPEWFNAPVPSFGPEDAQLLVVGLAPGLQGANRTGRPFTGDYAGELLYQTLLETGMAKGEYEADPEDSLRLKSCMITNAVRCVPPENKPTGAEIKACRQFLRGRMAHLPELRAVLALGRIAHDSVISARDQKQADFPFSHGARHEMPDGLVVYDSYHCSRYNTNTGRLTDEMFRDVLKQIREDLGLS
ncbi:uracil-DNA glycosylase [Dichotomicrobium thermohalophilum]|uniref:Type-5 uracil-DNA glycosylase n=1 Tax=Dichotomicrobium thermohalophilum TaxID=933063 RepID=A0A397Q2E7_9HYPH|nr:uracil-DNA glycosylase [Dichotomicrobium thermohalophilum]RIA55536.1 uracil-DNA glycosylase family 4 [Dichotomicrobium thermohalophilum]